MLLKLLQLSTTRMVDTRVMKVAFGVAHLKVFVLPIMIAKDSART